MITQCMYTCTVLALTYTVSALCLHLLALTCTCLHCYVSQHREVEKAFGATELSTSLYVYTALAQP